MSTYRLNKLLSPRSVALVGASPRHGSVGRAILNNIRKAQFKGEFGLVNPMVSRPPAASPNWRLRRSLLCSLRRPGPSRT